MADVFAAYKMKLQYPVTLQMNVKNLFDKTYYTSSIGTNNLGNQIGDPREVQFTVKMDFLSLALPRIVARCALSGLLIPSPCCGKKIPDNAFGLPILFPGRGYAKISLPMLQ